MNERVSRDHFNVDLTNCDREPIHIPGSIQPHGFLLGVDPATLEVVQCSRNAHLFTGVASSELRNGISLEQLLDTESVSHIRELINKNISGVTTPLNSTFRSGDENSYHLGNAHLYDGVLIVEYECRVNTRELLHIGVQGGVHSITRFVQQATAALQACESLDQLYQLLSQQIRQLSGFDRVMIYRFMPDLHGVVEGESLRAGLEPYLGLHYPATDIPQQARRLYTINPMRLIVDISAQSIPIEPTTCPITGRPLDLTYSSFRSVSPIHIEYLQNMGVAASMSVSIIIEGRLWGLIACHHYEPREISLEHRAACEMLGTMAGGYIATRQIRHNVEEKNTRQDLAITSLRNIAGYQSIQTGLMAVANELLEAVDANGVAICIGGNTSCVGITPPTDALETVYNQILNVIGTESWNTHELAKVFPNLASHSDIASGAMALRLGTESKDMIIFFRPQFESEINWAGNPDKTATVADDGVRLSPRKSFAQWTQTVHQQSRHWSEIDQSIVDELYSGLVRLIAGRAAEIERVNQQLIRINADLDSFAYAASHDLKEPLRTISQTVYFLERAIQSNQPDEITRRMSSIQQTVCRMTDLLEGLLRVSRAGSGDLALEAVDVAEVVREASELSLHFSNDPVQLVIHPLPVVQADFMCLRDVFQNLFVNARKYNKSSDKVIEVGYLQLQATESVPVAAQGKFAFYVRDNGIGIAPGHWQDVFQVFRRLHGLEDYGGGSGVGLAVVKRIIQRHGGTVWIDSQLNQGTTFFFTLEPDNNDQ